jgi:hypothetical protein
MCPSKYEPIDPSGMRCRSIHQRPSKVSLSDFARPHVKGGGIEGWLASLPNILAGREFRQLIKAVLTAREKKRAILWGLGAHVIKCGLSPLLIDLMDRGFLTGLALNGAGSIHDFEIALVGATSEEVSKELDAGDFGTSEETNSWMNEAIRQGASANQGLGEALGQYILDQTTHRFVYPNLSLLASAYTREIPVTVHVALGTDIIHNHPSASGEALGKTGLQDFRLFTSMVRDLDEGGVFLNCGSAVLLPEVFLKAVNMVRNLGFPLRNFTTANLDFIQHYRPIQNVVKRPTEGGGRGISLTGHHELMIPLLAAVLIEKSLP